MSMHRTNDLPEAQSYGNVEIRPPPHCLGAEIICDDLKRMDDAEAKFIYRAWLDHLVLLFTGQQLSDDDLVAFTLHFGTLKDSLPTHQCEAGAELNGHPNVSVISNVVENGVAIGVLGDGEACWHTDYHFN